jgi:hypothetical protein
VSRQSYADAPVTARRGRCRRFRGDRRSLCRNSKGGCCEEAGELGWGRLRCTGMELKDPCQAVGSTGYQNDSAITN